MSTSSFQAVKSPSKGALWTGRIITGLCLLFLLFDAIMKIIKESHSIEGSAKLGWPVENVQGLGIVLLLFTIIYMIPRIAVIGAILLTAYLGGAVAISVRVQEPYWFPIIFGVLVWAGLYFRNEKFRALVSAGK
jgi:DoxX-like protein